MKPIFTLNINGDEITSDLKNRVVSIKISDHAGHTSDTLECILSNHDQKLAIPQSGAKIEAALGYEQTGLVPMGYYIVGEVSVSLPARIITVKAHAADMTASLRAPKTRTWGNISLGNITQAIAQQHNLTPKISGSLASIQFAHVIQTEESDLHLLTRLAHDIDAMVKPVQQYLLIIPKSQGNSASGTALPPVVLSLEDIISCEVNFIERQQYNSVKCQWHNKETATTHTVTTGNGEPSFTIRHMMDSEISAKIKAESTLKQLSRGKAKLSLSLPGRPEISAERMSAFKGVDKKIEGNWIISSVTHSLDGNGLKTEIEATTV